MYRSLKVLWTVTLKLAPRHAMTVKVIEGLELDFGVTNFPPPKPSQRFTYLPAEMVGIYYI